MQVIQETNRNWNYWEILAAVMSETESKTANIERSIN